MELKEINPEKTPERFFMPRVDGESTIYDQIAEDTSVVNTDCIRSLKRMVHDGVAEFKMMNDHIEILWNDILIAQADLVAEVWHNAAWQSQIFNFETANITKVGDGTFRAVLVTDLPALSITDAVFGLEWEFAYELSGRQTFYLDVPGGLVRIKWRTEVLDSALGVNRSDEKGLKYSVDSYTGTADHTTPDHPTEGWSYHIWTFEPDGYTCDASDARTPLERYGDVAGLMVI